MKHPNLARLRNTFRLRRTIVWPMIASLPFMPMALRADGLPTGGHVTAGRVTIEAPGTASLLVNQSSQRAVVRWNDFSIGQGRSVSFRQPTGTAAILNIATGSAASVLAGNLQANGTVFLVNPNGIAVTPTGRINAQGGFVASTLGIVDDNFMAGTLLFGGKGASVVNRGRIVTGPGGHVVLLGSSVSNEGLIQAPLGKVALGSAQRATLDFAGDGFLQVALPADATAADGHALVSNSGQIQADGGSVVLKAVTVREAVREAVNMSGDVRARSVSGRDGAIVLEAQAGKVHVSGRLDASADTASGATQGGRIDVTGETVALQGASLTATGTQRGGLVRIGGAFQGGRAQDPDSSAAKAYVGRFGAVPALASATATVIDAASSIDVSSDRGTGGTAVVWSDSKTVMRGSIVATGATSGGAVEISSKSTIQSIALSRVNLGKGGTLLLDPQDIVIDATGTDPAGNTAYASNPGTATHLRDADVTALLSAGTNVSLQASQDISWLNNFTFVSRTPTTAGGNLALSAGRSVTLSGVFTTADGHWSIVANDTAANGVIDADRGTGAASINLFGASFINSNGNLSFTLADGAGNTNRSVDGILLGRISGNSVTAAIATTATADFGSPRIMLTENIDASGAISLTGNLQSSPSTNPVLSLGGQSVTWTSEKSGGVLRGEAGFRFVENGVTTRIGQLAAADAVRLELGDATPVAATRIYGDADPTFAGLGSAQLHVAAHSASAAAPDPLASILATGSLAVSGPGTLAAAGSGTLTVSPTTGVGFAGGLTSGYFVDLTPATIPLTIARRTVTPTVGNGASTYGSSVAVASLSNIVNSDVLTVLATLNGAAGVAMSANGSGFGFPATLAAGASTFSLTGLSGTAAGNYTLDVGGTVSGTLAVAPKPLTYVAGSGSQVYGSLAAMPQGSLAGIVGSDDVAPVVGLSAAGTRVTLAARLAVGSYASSVVSLSGSTAGNYTVAAAGNTDGTFDVSRKTVTYGIADSAGTYGTLASVGAVSFNGIVAGDSVTGSAAVTSLGSAIALTPTTAAGTYPALLTSVGGADAGNYQLAATGNASGVLTIATKPITYTGTDLSQTYGLSALPAPALNGVVGADQVNAVVLVSGTGNEQGASGAVPTGSYWVDAASVTGASAANYTISLAGSSPSRVTVMPKPLTFQVGSANSTYGTAAVLPRAALGGLVAGDAIGSVTAASRAGSAVAITPVTSAGSYALGVGGLTGTGAINYVVAAAGNTPGILTIAPKPLTWQVAADSAVYGDPLTNAATLDALVPGDTVTIGIAALDANGVAIARPAVGTHAVSVTSLGGPLAGNYALAASGNTPGAVDVTPRPLTYAIAPTASVYGTLAVDGAVTLTNLLPGDAIGTTVGYLRAGSAPGPLTARSPAGSYSSQVTALSGNSNYALAQTGNADGTLTIAPKALTFATPNASSVYGTAAVLGTGSVSGVLAGDDVAPAATMLATGAAPGARMDVGAYPIAVSGLSGPQAGNYALTSVGSTRGVLDISPRPVTYSVDLAWARQAVGESVTYGTLYDPWVGFDVTGSPFTAQTRLAGLLPGDAVTLGVNAPVVPLSTSGAYAAGTYRWTGGALSSPNYVVAGSGNSDRSLTITPRPMFAFMSATDAASYQVPIAVYGTTAGIQARVSLATTGLGRQADQVTATASFATPQGNVQQLLERQGAGTYPIVLTSGLTGADAGNYTLAPAPAASFQIYPRMVTVELGTAISQYRLGTTVSTYGRQAVLPAGNVNGVLPGDTLAPSFAVYSTYQNYGGLGERVNLAPRTSAGTYTITAGGLTGPDAGNYTLTWDQTQLQRPLGYLQIQPLPVTLTADPANQSFTYGTYMTPATASGVLSGDDVRVLSQARLPANGYLLVADAGATLLDAGVYAYTGALGGPAGGNYYVPSPALGTIHVARRPLSATVPDRSTTYGTSLAAQPEFTNLVPGQMVGSVVSTFDASGAAVNYSERTDAGTFSNRVTSLSGSVAENYVLASTSNGRLTVVPKSITWQALPVATGVYGTAVKVGTLAGVQFDDDVAVASADVGTQARSALKAGAAGAQSFEGRVDAGEHAFSISASAGLVGSKGANYTLVGGDGAPGVLKLARRQVYGSVDRAWVQYGGYEACNNATCDPWTPAGAGRVSLTMVLAGDSVEGVGGIVDARGVASTFGPSTAVGTYNTVVTGLQGPSAHNYVLAASSGFPMIVERLWLSYKTSSAVYLPGPGLIGSPGSPELRGPGGAAPGAAVEAVVTVTDPGGAIVTDLSTLRPGQYVFRVTGLRGADAANYVLRPDRYPYNMNGTPFATNDAGTLDVFSSTTLGLGLVGTQPVPLLPVITPAAQPAGLLSTQANASFGTSATAGLTGAAAGATAGAQTGATLSSGPGYVTVGAQGSAGAVASVGIGGAQLSAQSTVSASLQGGASGSLGSAGTGSASATTSAFASAQSDAKGTLNGTTVVTSVQQSAGVGVSAGAKGGISGQAGSADTNATVYSPGVVGAKVDFSGGYSNGAVSLGLDLGAQLGIGGLALKFNFSVNTAPLEAAFAPVTSFFGLGGGSAPRVESPAEVLMNAAVNMRNDPLGRLAYLESHPQWHSGYYASRGYFEVATNFVNGFKRFGASVERLQQDQANAQSHFLGLLRTDPAAAVAYIHSRAFQDLKVRERELALSASNLGVKLTRDGDHLTLVNR